MSAASQRWRQMTLWDTPNATSSPASAGGPTPCAFQGGPTTFPYGPALALASRSAQQGREPAQKIPDTCGPSGSGSSASAVLTLSLANRLKQRLSTDGSTLFRLTWKEKVTPSGRLLSRLVASARPISDSGCGSWPTAAARDYFPAHTPEYIAAKKAQGHGMANLNDTVQLSSWPTTDAAVGNLTDSSWQERRAAAAAKHGNNGFGLTLGQAATLASWPTASARDWKGATHERWGTNARPLNEVARLASGPLATGSPAPTEKSGQLNPAFSLWLMGYDPAAWLLAAPSDKPQPCYPQKKPRTNSAALEPCEVPETPSFLRPPPK